MAVALAKADQASMSGKTFSSQRLLIGACIAIGLLAAIVLHRIFDNAQWWWLWAS